MSHSKWTCAVNMITSLWGWSITRVWSTQNKCLPLKMFIKVHCSIHFGTSLKCHQQICLINNLSCKHLEYTKMLWHHKSFGMAIAVQPQNKKICMCVITMSVCIVKELNYSDTIADISSIQTNFSLLMER